MGWPSPSRARDELLKSVPDKYLSGLSGEERERRKREIERRSGSSRRKYSPLPSDEGAKTKPSKYTRTSIARAIREEMQSSSKKEFVRAASKVSGVSVRILREVHERGAAAWGTGHRVGASQIAWSRARVYSFLTGGKTQKTADADLWREVIEERKK
jgi:hypothetical protein